MKISLICSTRGRKKELELFLKSLVGQTHSDYEVIIVNHNPPGFIDDIISTYSGVLCIKHISINPTSLAAARNYGLAHVQGEIIGFPDDDCEYPSDLLQKIVEKFIGDKTISIISGSCRDQTTLDFSASRYCNGTCYLDLDNLWIRHVSIGLFFKREVFNGEKFDERLGVGNKFGSGEETDMLMRVLYKGHSGLYDSNIYAFHPNPPKNGSEASIFRAFSYGLGWGALFKKHMIVYHRRGLIRMYLYSVFRSLIGLSLALLSFRIGLAKFYAYSAAGRVCGFLSFKP